MRINRSSRFRRSFQKLPGYIQDDFDQKIRLFLDNPFHPSLRTHKLSGSLTDYYAFSLRDGFRVLFVFGEPDVAILVNIGGHGDYSKWSRQ